MKNQVHKQAEVSSELSGQRLDQVAARLFPDYSRARLQGWIKAGELTVNALVMRPRDKVYANDRLVLQAVLESKSEAGAEPVPLHIIHEDEQLLVLNKPAGLVVHPAAGHHEGTLLNGLLFHCPGLQLLPRAGIVHRLDKDTTGLMVVAKTPEAHHRLTRALQRREVTREYDAVVTGVMTAGGVIDLPLGRHPVHRKKRAVTDQGKPAVTHYTVAKRFRHHTHVHLQLETGRTHQIRVHLSHLGYPIIGDRTYGGRLQIPRDCPQHLAELLRGFPRQALHASRLALMHPMTGEIMQWQIPLPEDMRGLLAGLQQDLDEHRAHV